MKKILLIESSPRKEQSITNNVCEKLIASLQVEDEWELERIDLWNEVLPDMNGDTLAAKYAIFEDKELSSVQKENWMSLKDHINRFSEADLVIITAPTWNWGIPYVLKHYIDVVTQPGLTFSWTPEDGYTSLLNSKRAVLITSSGGDYTEGSGNEKEDFVIKYMNLWLTSCMGCDVDMINMTLSAAGEEFLNQAYQRADEKIAEICEKNIAEMA